jgi:type I restriction enzyme M protein
VIEHGGDPEYSLITRSSDGQMVFLANMLSKMKKATKVGSRIAEVHNSSSLFTGDAGSGESNLRRWVIENDWLEAIIALPLNIFYNIGIATYIWVLSNRKAKSRKGKVQLIDATAWFKPLRKNLGKKNCVLGPDDIKRICNSLLKSEESEQSKLFPNQAFGYWKVTVERPLRLKVDLSANALRRFVKACSEAAGEPLVGVAEAATERLGEGPHFDFRPPEQTALPVDAVDPDLRCQQKLPAARGAAAGFLTAEPDPDRFRRHRRAHRREQHQCRAGKRLDRHS